MTKQMHSMASQLGYEDGMGLMDTSSAIDSSMFMAQHIRHPVHCLDDEMNEANAPARLSPLYLSAPTHC